MFGLIIIIGVLAFLGFLMSWIANIVAREDMPVMTGFLIVFIAGAVSLVAGFALSAFLGDLATYVQPVLNFGVLFLTIKLFGGLEWKPSAIMAAIYSALLLVVGLSLSMCTSA